MRVVVVGGGVSGLGSALSLARHGHDVVVVERDHTPMPESADEAFDWDRRGAPQVRHSHAFLAKLCLLLRTDYPDIYASLLAEGATELLFGRDLPPEMVEFSPDPGDADLTMLACRRTTFEWVVRKAALAEGRVEFVTGSGVVALVTADSQQGASVPVVAGVRLDNGSEIGADLVVIAGGRRSTAPEWMAAIGTPAVPEEIEDTGIVYLSRFYRLREGQQYPPRSGAIGGDLGYLKYGVFVGDNDTFSITLAVPTDDDDLRKRLADPEMFDLAAAQLVATEPWVDGRAVPITPSVHVMAGLLNRRRHYVVDGEPLALGVVPVGDAVLCTNPLYGRGCSIAFWAADLLTKAIASTAEESPVARLRSIAIDYDAALCAEILPWYLSSVEQDKEARRVAAALLAGQDPDTDADDPRAFMRGVFRDGLLPALRSDQVVLRAFMRNLNLLVPPDAMAKDADVGARVLAVWQTRDQRPPLPAMGPRRRAEFAALLPG
ncbi:MAG TPA: FAD-dependent oxidoreductase [Ilumatobacteraceae bacterium]|nr:FAD-dependent oxidoreductase [Ilumatobacteraceae bacterium]